MKGNSSILDSKYFNGLSAKPTCSCTMPHSWFALIIKTIKKINK